MNVVIMSMFDDYNVLMNDLCLDLKQVTRGMVTLRSQIASDKNRLDNAQNQAAEEIQSFVGRLTSSSNRKSSDGPKVSHEATDESETSILAAFQKFKEDLQKTEPIQRSEKGLAAIIAEQENLSKQCVVIERMVNTLCVDIDRWLTSTMKKPRLPLRHRGIRGKKARDIHTIAWLDQKLPDARRELKEIQNDVNSVRKSHTALIGSYPNHLQSVIESIITLLDAKIASVQRLQEHRQWLSKSETRLPETYEEWKEQFVKELVNREQHIAPNLPLNPTDVRTLTTNLFDDGIDRRRHVLHQIKQEQGALDTLIEEHAPNLKLHHFDYGYRGAKKGKPSRKIRQIVDSELKSGKATKKESNLHIQIVQHETRVEACYETLLGLAKPSVRRHFKDEPFSILIITSNKIKPADFLGPYKKSWHLYPNYHLCMDSIKKTTMKQRELDALLKLPLSAKLCTACLDGTLTREQAMILQDIDVHNDLYTMFEKQAVPLDLVFALHAQEGQAWLDALLRTPKLHEIVAEHRHDPFNESLWNLVVEKRIKPWHYACIARLNFSEEHALETLLLAEEVWKELNEYAALYEVEEELRHLVEIYKPSNDKEFVASAPLSLSDVMQTLEPIAEFTVDKASTKSKKVTRKKRGRHSF